MKQQRAVLVILGAFLIHFHSVILLTVFEENWCDRSWDCKIDGKLYFHTLCVNRPHKTLERNYYGYTDKFSRIKSYQTEAMRKSILALHNHLRNDLAEGKKDRWKEASNMRQLTWDNELEIRALRWAMQCYQGHDVCRRMENFEEIGQSCGWLKSTKSVSSIPPWETIFRNWRLPPGNFIDVESFHKEYQDNHFFRNFGQLFWANTYKLGCAEVSFKMERLELGTVVSLHYHRAFVCDYAPGMNVNLSKIYKEGPSCFNCPSGTACHPSSIYPHLCAFPTDPVDSDHIAIAPRDPLVNLNLIVLLLVFNLYIN